MSSDLMYEEALNILSEIHLQRPDLRLGQVLQQAVDKSTSTKNQDFHNISTKKLCSSLSSYRDTLRRGE
jgi:hypothetical protein